MAFSVDAVEGGYGDPVLACQAVFRAIMDAMSRPGTVFADLPVPRPPEPLSPVTAAVVLALCDADTPVWLDPALAASPLVGAWIGFHTGAQRVQSPADGHFAVIGDPAGMIGLDNFSQGTQEYPDRSATLVLSVGTLAAGVPLLLEGPGIRTVSRLAPAPMPRHFVQQWNAMHARFPRGVDLVLAAPDGVAALPRTTRISIGEV